MRKRINWSQRNAATFAALEQAAVDGRRCPENGCFGVAAGTVPGLAREGLIMVAVYAHNYRVVTIMTGPHKGKSTAPCPWSRKPYKVIRQG